MKAAVSESPWSADFEERNHLTGEHLPLVRAIALRMSQNLPAHLDIEDLVQAGTIGLLDAAAEFDPENVVEFRVYAKHRIRGAILDSLRRLDLVSRRAHRNHRRVEAAAQELAAVPLCRHRG